MKAFEHKVHIALPMKNKKETQKFYTSLGFRSLDFSPSELFVDFFDQHIAFHEVGSSAMVKSSDIKVQIPKTNQNGTLPSAHFGAFITNQEYFDMLDKFDKNNVEIVFGPNIYDQSNGVEEYMTFFKDCNGIIFEIKANSIDKYGFDLIGEWSHTNTHLYNKEHHSDSEYSIPDISNLPEGAKKRLLDIPALNIFRVLGYKPDMVIPFTDLISTIYKSQISPYFREIAILRQAYKGNCIYEKHHHISLAKENQVPQSIIDAILSDKPNAKLQEKELLVVNAADEIEENANLSEVTLKKLHNYFTKQEVFELIISISFYCCVGRIANSLNIQIEDISPLINIKKPIGEL
ncbi:hypothetical protein [Francisella sp. SYW-9]|uniref:hypothetical protein n=1 Tax=Francisella sp. SYW-9 TaxID=2610888 RepID=UPI00123E2280|nr:hypothetical protein [Francisella sp. SYW-9]